MMEARDVKVGDKVFVEIRRGEGAEMAHGHHMNGFVLVSCREEYVNFLKLDDDHQVYPSLLELCKKLTYELGLAVKYMDKLGKELDPMYKSRQPAHDALKEADAILGLKKDEGR